jgi:hypothetical protein
VAGSAAPLTVIDKVPLAAPELLGVKVMLIVVDWPGASTMGSVPVVTPKPAPVAVTCENVMLGPSLADELVRVMELLLLLPTETLPKSMLEVLRLKLAVLLTPVVTVDWVLCGMTPAHETPNRAAKHTTTTPDQLLSLVLKTFIYLRRSLGPQCSYTREISPTLGTTERFPQHCSSDF